MTLAERANETAALSRRGGAPGLSDTSSRLDVVAWLQWCDPNGSHTDAAAAADDRDPYTLSEAWEALADMLEDA